MMSTPLTCLPSTLVSNSSTAVWGGRARPQ
jgi:hypothetical protein